MVATSSASISAILIIYIPKSRVREIAHEQAPRMRSVFDPPAGPYWVRWTSSYTGALIGLAVITANLCEPATSWLCIKAQSVDQRITLVSRPRHFGGGHWYFVCPVTKKRASVLWMPSAASEFCSRHAWGREIAYRSQFRSVYDRGHAGNTIDRRWAADKRRPPAEGVSAGAE
jgi:hypothetical protein